eukprot:Pgem_evm1s16494
MTSTVDQETLSKILDLFNVVPIQPLSITDSEECKPCFIKDHGVLIAESALGYQANIQEYYLQKSIDLNSTFHKSWSKIMTASSEQLWIEQCLHYYTTYGPGRDTSTIYFPAEVLDVPDKVHKIPILVIHGLEAEEIVGKCLDLFKSGIALKQETIVDIVFVMEGLAYKFTGKEKIKNKEAMMYVADYTGSTQTTMIIKNKDIIDQIKTSSYQLPELNSTQLKTLAKSFNRYKPLWITFKKAHANNPKTVNRISKLSKKYHEPMPVDVLSNLTSNFTFSDDDVKAACQKATLYQVIRALNAVRLYSQGNQARLYRVRNGKSFIKCQNTKTLDIDTFHHSLKNYEILLQNFLANQLQHLKGKKIYIPPNIDYALPVSEKLFTEKITKGTVVKLPFLKKNDVNDPDMIVDEEPELLLIGIHWTDNVDFDLSSITLAGSKIGWNSGLRNESRTLLHSGDVTAVDDKEVGASEFLYCSSDLSENCLIYNNLYSHNGYEKSGLEYNIVLGYGPKTIAKNHIIDPNRVIFKAKTQNLTKQTVVGFVKSTEEGLEFYLLDQGFGNIPVSGASDLTKLCHQYIVSVSGSAILFRELFKLAQLTVVEEKEEADIDLDIDVLSKETF